VHLYTCQQPTGKINIANNETAAKDIRKRLLHPAEKIAGDLPNNIHSFLMQKRCEYKPGIERRVIKNRVIKNKARSTSLSELVEQAHLPSTVAQVAAVLADVRQAKVVTGINTQTGRRKVPGTKRPGQVCAF
jgi:primosomal protein N''